MTSLIFHFQNCRNLPLKLQCFFQNVTKLKAYERGLRCKQTPTACLATLSGSSTFYLRRYMSSISCVSSVFSNTCFLWNVNCKRWIRFSSQGLLTNPNSRKKQKTKSELLAERVRVRFPSKFRETKKDVARKMGEIKENILTIPNGLCALRIVATPIIGYLVLSELYAISLGLFIFAGFTDMVDGYIARTFPKQQSMIGSFLDPAADKLLIATLFITLTANGLIPVPLTFLIIARDACLMGAGFYIRYLSLPPPKTLSRYFNMSFATAKLSPTTISKANTLIQLSLVAASLAAPVFNFQDHLYLQSLWYITATTTLLSGASYLYYKNETYKLFNLPKKNHKM